jgi:hypothetical protein
MVSLLAPSMDERINGRARNNGRMDDQMGRNMMDEWMCEWVKRRIMKERTKTWTDKDVDSWLDKNQKHFIRFLFLLG